MRKSLVAFAVLGMFAMVVNANDITFYFGRPETPGTVTTAFVASSAYPGAAGGLPGVAGLTQGPGTYTLGIWANVPYNATAEAMDVWNGISFDVVGAGGNPDPAVTVSNLFMDNFDHRVSAGTAYRWESSSDFGGAAVNDFLLVSVTRFGLGGLWTPQWAMGMGSTDWWSYTQGTVGTGTNRYWLGNVTLSCTDTGGVHNVFFKVDTRGIGRQGGSVTNDHIFFGEDDPTWVLGNQFGAITPLPEFAFTPEPASLILISLAGLFLRRR